MNCRECHWFKTKARFGRDLKSCQDLGETEESEACDRFMAGPQDSNMAEWVQEKLGALENVRYRDLFHEILSECFVLEQDTKLAIATIQAQLQTQGATVVLEGRDFEQTTSRLLAIWQTYRLACVLGLGRFADQIVEAEIKRRFVRPQGIQVLPSVPTSPAHYPET